MTNVVLLIADEHNPRISEPYGHPMVQTPNMARLAEDGVVYESAYCPSPLCMPSRSAFLSGRWVHEIQVYNNCTANLSPIPPTYGGVLAAQGVHAVHLGKMHGYGPPEGMGFAEMRLAGGFSQRGGDANICRTPVAVRPDGADRADRYGPHPTPFQADTRTMAAALEWLEGRAPTLDAPWVLSINLHAPHFPHYVTQELWDLYPEGGDLPEHGRECASAQHPYAQDLRHHFQTERFTEAQVRGLRRGYLGCVTWVDRQLGRLLEALDRLGLSETTDLIYTADHGEMLGKFGMWWKCSLYEDSVRVPLIAAGPSYTKGVRLSTPVSLLDVQAGLFLATGARRPEAWRGRPLPEIGREPERVGFAEYHGHGTRSGAYMVRRGEWKLHYYMAAPHQLFHLGDDPEELHNLAGQRPDVVEALTRELYCICDPELENHRAHAFERAQLGSLPAG